MAELSNYDVNGLDNIYWSVENGGFNFYSGADYNMDGDINAEDKTIWRNNNGVSTWMPK